MTKAKVMEDLLGRTDIDYLNKCGEYNVYLNGHCIIADKEEIPIPTPIEENKIVKQWFEKELTDNLAYELSEAIEVDYDALKKFMKEHKKWEKIPFIIDLGQNRYLCVNPWLLRDMIEYLSDRWTKNYRIFIKNKFSNKGEYKIYIGALYMFGGNQMDDQKILLLPVNWLGDITPHMKCEVKWS